MFPAIENALESSNMLQNLALVVLLAPMLAAVSSLLFRRRPRLMNWITTVSSLVSLLASAAAIPYVIQKGQRIIFTTIPLPGVDFYLDALSLYFVLLVNLVALFASFGTQRFLDFDAREHTSHRPESFHFFFNVFHLTMLLVPMVDNLVILWIAVELTTVFSTILVRYRRDRLSLEAAWKFIMITTTGIIFALLGTLFLANAFQLSSGKVFETMPGDLMRWSFLANSTTIQLLQPNKSFMILSFLFILVGYGTKAGLAPMHTWLPDGHGQAPAPVSALLSGVMLKMALYAILRFYTITNLVLGSKEFTSWLMTITGLFSLVLAAPFVLKRNRFKRVLAYHSLEHMGIITFGIGIGGIGFGAPVALFGALLHALNHALTKALMFLVYGSIQYEYQKQCGSEVMQGEGEQSIQGVLRAMPFSGTILAFGGLALVGSPPFNIFMSEFIILWAAVQQAVQYGQLALIPAIIVFVLSLMMIFGGLVNHLARLLLGAAPFPPVEPSWQRIWIIAPFLALIMVVILFGIVVPDWPLDLPAVLRSSVQILQTGAPLPANELQGITLR